MAIRLAEATVIVALVAYLTSPWLVALLVMAFGFLVAWRGQSVDQLSAEDQEQDSIPEPGSDERY